MNVVYTCMCSLVSGVMVAGSLLIRSILDPARFQISVMWGSYVMELLKVMPNSLCVLPFSNFVVRIKRSLYIGWV